MHVNTHKFVINVQAVDIRWQCWCHCVNFYPAGERESQVILHMTNKILIQCTVHYICVVHIEHTVQSSENITEEAFIFSNFYSDSTQNITPRCFLMLSRMILRDWIHWTIIWWSESEISQLLFTTKFLYHFKRKTTRCSLQLFSDIWGALYI